MTNSWRVGSMLDFSSRCIGRISTVFRRKILIFNEVQHAQIRHRCEIIAKNVPRPSRVAGYLRTPLLSAWSYSPSLHSLRLYSFWGIQSGSDGGGSYNKNQHVDLFSKYRRPITQELWEEFQEENFHTQNHAVAPDFFHQIFLEIQEAVTEVWENQEAPAEFGPTGVWMYNFVVRSDENGSSKRRLYQRYRNRLDNNENIPEVVVELEPQEELLAMSLTPDETCIALLVQDSDSGNKVLRLRAIESEVETRVEGHQCIIDTTSVNDVISLEWGASVLDHRSQICQQSLYLVLGDEQGRPSKVVSFMVSHETMTPLSQPTVIYDSDDPAVIIDVQRTKGCDYVAIQALTKTSNEIHLCSNPTEPLLLVKARREGVLYHLDVGTDKDLVILVSDEQQNDGNFMVIESSVDKLPLHENLRNTLGDDEGNTEYFVEDMDLFRNFLILYERSTKTGLQRVKICRRRCHDSKEINCPITDNKIIIDLAGEKAALWCKLSPAGNMNFDSNVLRFELESPVTPGCVYQYSFEQEQLTRVSDILKGDDNINCNRQLVFVESSDGTKVPLSLFYDSNRIDRSASPSEMQTSPVVLVGYGAYGEPMNLGYDPSWLPLINRGALLAFAHTRGGGELGKSWHWAGRSDNKVRSIEDFEACAKYLKSRFKNRPLTTKVFSAGGVLAGAVVNRQPGLFDKVVMTNSYVDVFATMQNPSLFLTEHEYAEFGNPTRDAGMAKLISSYCPIYNLDPAIQCKTSTKFLLIGTLDDQNVPYWNATLYFTKLKGEDRNIGSGGMNVFLYLQRDGGHNNAGPNRLALSSLEISFLLSKADNISLPYVVV